MIKNYVLIPAAGHGSRMGTELPKQHLPILGKPLIQYALEVFCHHPKVTEVYVLLAPEDKQDYALPKCRTMHCGGATRAETVLNALQQLQCAEDDWILVHDAVRPCINQELLNRLFTELEYDAVGGLLAMPVADTLKRSGADQRVADTEPRANLWQAQTPQMFRFGLLKQALQKLGTALPTDEAQAIEFLGHAPKLVMGDSSNLKVTYPRDLALAELILRANL
ncbi:MAG TPA: 2-C-methyl-D-erythritol 4-phosphate cytidylyltransferase [Methylophilaceae bacterium]|jgi:2-C-methyl-D-erythritol 4-phosphate cytidylyltransferase